MCVVMQSYCFKLLKGIFLSEHHTCLSCGISRNQFYQIFYGVFDDQFAVMDALLNQKESFALQVLLLLFYVLPFIL